MKTGQSCDLLLEFTEYNPMGLEDFQDAGTGPIRKAATPILNPARKAFATTPQQWQFHIDLPKQSDPSFRHHNVIGNYCIVTKPPLHQDSLYV